MMFFFGFSDSKHHINYAKAANGDLLPRTKFLQENCKKPYYKDPKCSHPNSLNSLCQNSTLHISKTVRLGLDVALNFLDDPNVKIIYVVRDPRGKPFDSGYNLSRYRCVIFFFCNTLYFLT